MKPSSCNANGSIGVTIESDRSRKPIGIRSRKAKGRVLQDHVRDSFRSHFKALLSNDDISSAIMGESGNDVKMSPLAKSVIPFDVECKNCEKWNMSSFWKQTIANTGDGRVPLLVLKKNRSEVLCTLRFVDLLRLLK